MEWSKDRRVSDVVELIQARVKLKTSSNSRTQLAKMVTMMNFGTRRPITVSLSET